VTDEDLYEECRQRAIAAGALEPQGFREGLSANWLSYKGRSFAETPVAQARLQAWIEECVQQASQE
jgi:hypothetical protein